MYSFPPCDEGWPPGDLLLTQYLTYELSKGDQSFYYPYIRILPEPGSVSKWSDAELDEQLKHRAERKRSQIKIVYNGLMTALNARYPEFFSPHVFTIDRFCFAFDTIQVDISCCFDYNYMLTVRKLTLSMVMKTTTADCKRMSLLCCKITNFLSLLFFMIGSRLW